MLFGVRRARWIAPVLALVSIVWRTADWHYNFAAKLLRAPALVHNGARSDYCADSLLWGCTLAPVLATADRAPLSIQAPQIRSYWHWIIALAFANDRGGSRGSARAKSSQSSPLRSGFADATVQLQATERGVMRLRGGIKPGHFWG